MNISKKLLLGPVCIALLTISLGVASLLSLRHVKYALVFAVLVVSFVVINWLIAKSISNPIKALQKGVEIVGTGNLDYRISTSGTDEIAQLARSFDAMVISLKTLTVSRDRLNQELAERKLVVEELRRSEAQFKAIYESSNDAMVLLADEGFVECNRRAVEMFGAASKAEFLKLKPEDISPLTQPDGANSVSAGMVHAQRALQDGCAHFEWIHRRANGESFPAEISFSAFDFQGRRVMLSTVRDISERRKMEDALREREETFHAMTQSTSSAIMLTNADGQITFWNTSAERIFGYSAEEAFGMNMYQLIAPGKFHKTQSRIKSNAVNGSVQHRVLEMAAIHKSGNQFPVELNISPMNLRGRRHATVIIRDITERKKMEEEMRAAREEAEAANRMKSTFLANMSHEIRTPMNGILGMATLLMDTEMSPEQRDFAETLQRSGESLLTIINDILDYSKVEAGRMELEQIDFNLRHCVEDIADLLALRAQEKGLEFICLIDEELPDYVCGDPGRIRQVLTNLLGNAVKFTEKGEVSLHVGVGEKSADRVTILCEVRDTGIGISPEDQKRLFQPFTQVDSSTARRFGGTGLGLSITRQLIQLMDGHIKMESEVGRGSIFRLALALGCAKTQQPLAMQSGELAGRRVLAVDDNKTNRQLLHSLLSGWSCEVELAADAASAMEKLRVANRHGRPFDLALLDMQMPVVSGEELGRRIKQDKALKETRLVMITSLGERGDAQRLLRIGFAGYLSKPVRREQLRRCLETVLSYSEERSAAEQPLVTSHILQEQRKGSRRILVVEDNPVNRKVARGMIEKMGFSVEMACNGQEALDALRGSQFDLVIMDCQMPEMDGYEATTRLRNPVYGALRSNVPVIAMTANAMKGDPEKCLMAGMDDYVSKPVNPPELAAAIERWLDRSHPTPKTAQAACASVASEQNDNPSVVAPLTASEQSDFNPADLLDRLSGDQELASVVVQSFVEEVQNQMIAFRQALAGADAAEGQRLAHSIKGASGSVACPRLHELARLAESACRDGRLDDARDAGAEFFAAFAQAESAFRKAGLCGQVVLS